VGLRGEVVFPAFGDVVRGWCGVRARASSGVDGLRRCPDGKDRACPLRRRLFFVAWCRCTAVRKWLGSDVWSSCQLWWGEILLFFRTPRSNPLSTFLPVKALAAPIFLHHHVGNLVDALVSREAPAGILTLSPRRIDRASLLSRESNHTVPAQKPQYGHFIFRLILRHSSQVRSQIRSPIRRSPRR